MKLPVRLGGIDGSQLLALTYSCYGALCGTQQLHAYDESCYTLHFAFPMLPRGSPDLGNMRAVRVMSAYPGNWNGHQDGNAGLGNDLDILDKASMLTPESINA